MNTFRGRLFGPGLPGGGAEARARWLGDRLEIAAGGRTWSVRVERVVAAGFDGRLRVEFRDAAEDGEADFAFFLDEPGACPAFAAGAPAEITAHLRDVARDVRGVERRFRLGWFALGLVLLLPFVPVAVFLARSDAVAAWAVDRIPAEQEARFGDLALAQTRARMALADSGPAVDAVRLIGQRLTPGTRLQYRWFVADAPQINAFAAPGGVVVVFSGLIRAAERPEELAGVIAHEVAHAELRHGLRAMVKGLGLSALLSVALGDLSGGGLEKAIANLTELRFSRDAEREADADGLKRMVAARIDPQGMVRFLERLDEEGKAAVPALLSTHPVTGERLETLRREVAAAKIESTPLALDWVGVKRGL
jgi:Zn-dependent protease with chaperone function